jgi:hypothetical protein
MTTSETVEISEHLMDLMVQALTELPYQRVQPIFDIMTDEYVAREQKEKVIQIAR